MVWTLGEGVVAGLGIVLLQYLIFRYWNRRRAHHLLVRIESTFDGKRHLNSVLWLSSSQFQVQLQLAGCGFLQPAVRVQMTPRELPLGWMISRIRKRCETLTFEADLLYPPGFNLEVQNQHWQGITRNRLSSKKSVVRLRHIGPFILTSRPDWQRDITSMMHALSASRDCNLLSVSFRRSSPHFSATIPLDTIAGQTCTPVRVFDVLRELASGASAARF